MPIYLYWGEDDFAMAKAVTELRERVLDKSWASFNFDKIPPEQADGAIFALNQAMTPPFGAGGRLVWLADTTLCQHCSAELQAELERTLPAVPERATLLLTASGKPDGRLKSTKLLQKWATVKEFSLIPAWKTDELVARVREAAGEKGVRLTPGAVELLAESVGNDTRQLFAELDKLRLYAGEGKMPLDEAAVGRLVTATAQNSFQLAAAIREGDTAGALELVADLLNRNEPALRIVATLTGQFRTWLWVKLMTAAGERDEQIIAQAAEVGNPKRIYFLRKEVSSVSLEKLQKVLPVLLELELSLKRGAQEMSALQIVVIELCQIMS
jgi:DNA polymerase-3 subunit delta